eukprot:3884846-Rhodomonas_salina.4
MPCPVPTYCYAVGGTEAAYAVRAAYAMPGTEYTVLLLVPTRCPGEDKDGTEGVSCYQVWGGALASPAAPIYGYNAAVQEGRLLLFMGAMLLFIDAPMHVYTMLLLLEAYVLTVVAYGLTHAAYGLAHAACAAYAAHGLTHAAYAAYWAARGGDLQQPAARAPHQVQIAYKKPPLQYYLYQEGGFLYEITNKKPLCQYYVHKKPPQDASGTDLGHVSGTDLGYGARLLRMR